MSGDGSLGLLWGAAYVATTVVVAFLPWWLARDTGTALTWRAVGIALSVSAASGAFMLVTGESWSALTGYLLMWGSFWVAMIVASTGVLIAAVRIARSEGRVAALRPAAVFALIVVLALTVGVAPMRQQASREERFEARVTDMALSASEQGVPLEEIESRLLRAGRTTIERESEGGSVRHTAFDRELVKLWHPAAKFAHLRAEPSRWELPEMLEDDALVLEAADEAARDRLADLYHGFQGIAADATFTVIERTDEDRERAERAGLRFKGFRIVGPEGTTLLFENHRFKRIIFKVSEGTAADSDGYLVCHVYLASPDGLSWHAVGAARHIRTP